MNSSALSNAEHLAGRLKDVGSLIAHMYRKNTAVLPNHLRQRINFPSFRKSAWRINQAKRHTKCAKLHLSSKSFLELLELTIGRIAVFKAHHAATQSSMADEHTVIPSFWGSSRLFCIIGNRVGRNLDSIHRELQFTCKIFADFRPTFRCAGQY